MPSAKEDNILIKILFNVKGYNAKDLVREILSKGWNLGLVYKLLQKLQMTGSVDHLIVPAAADNTTPAQLITLILFTNWYYTKVAK